ncbi:MAG: Aminoglycoside N(6)-acetyltransferase [Bacteroidota bacterium]|jgi:RimJ/RimL family protein N-acetyltransferase
MIGRITYLRAMEESDIAMIRDWNFDPEIRVSFVNSFPVSMFEQKKWYEKQMTDNSKKKLVICDKETNEAIGVISAMKIDHINKNCEVGWTIGNKNFWGKGHAVDAIFSFCDLLFQQFNMHMMYGYVLSTNEKTLHFDQNKIGFEVTGRYKESLFKDGVYIDNMIVCLFKENFYKKFEEYKSKWK